MHSPILLLENGALGRFWLDSDLTPQHAGVYVSPYDPEPLTLQTFLSPSRDNNLLDEITWHLRQAIVKYE